MRIHSFNFMFLFAAILITSCSSDDSDEGYNSEKAITHFVNNAIITTKQGNRVRIKSISDRNNTINFIYDSQNRIVKIEENDDPGHCLEFSYDPFKMVRYGSNNNPVSEHLFTLNRNGYIEREQVTKTKNRDGNTWFITTTYLYNYDSDGHMTSCVQEGDPSSIINFKWEDGCLKKFLEYSDVQNNLCQFTGHFVYHFRYNEYYLLQYVTYLGLYGKPSRLLPTKHYGGKDREGDGISYDITYDYNKDGTISNEHEIYTYSSPNRIVSTYSYQYESVE